MKNTAFILSSILLLQFLGSCTSDTEVDNSVIIKGDITNPSSHQISIISMDLLSELLPLGEAPVDSAGHFEVKLQLKGPMEAYLLYGNNRTDLYLEPGFDLAVKFDATYFQNSIAFSGKGSTENTFLKEMNAIHFRYQKIPMEDIGTFRDFFQEYTTLANSMIDEFEKIEMKKVSELFIQIERTKIVDHFLTAFNRFEKRYRMTNEEMFDLRSNEKQYWSRLDLQYNELLISAAHRKTVQTYLGDLASKYLRSGGTTFKASWDQALQDFLTQNSIHPDYREFARAYKINQVLGFVGYKEAREDYASFIQNYPESRMLTPLKRKFAPWLALANGKPAPDFMGISPKGDEISLEDLLGNVVYIDVWASWCKPCYEEFPYSIQLKQRFSDEDPIRFMYVSIDDDSSNWMNGLSRIPEVKGVHVLVENAWQSDFAEKYSIKDIPRYILIDKEGKMADMIAKRPSAGEDLYEEIRSLLK